MSCHIRHDSGMPQNPDEEARRCGFMSAADMAHYVEQMEEQDAHDSWLDAGAPSPLAMWRQLQGLEPAPPLTVEQAAQRVSRSARQVRRWLPELAARGVAMKVGSRWNIDPDGLDAYTAEPKSRTPADRPKVKGSDVGGTGDLLWPK